MTIILIDESHGHQHVEIVAKSVHEAFGKHMVEYLQARFGGRDTKTTFKLVQETERSEHARTVLSGELNVYNG